ncbi:MAG: GNAT family N-acetyltransferase [Candidatus Krumholzibacteriia bacterium]
MSNPPLALEIDDRPPAGWDDLATVAAADFFATGLFVTALAEHLPGAQPLFLALRQGDRLVAGLPAIRRARRGLGRWHSLPDGTTGGPLVAPDLPSDLAERAVSLLTAEFRARLGGREITATMSLSAESDACWRPLLARAGWERISIPTSVIPLDGGLAHVESQVLPKNRRNERNRGLRRGARLATTTDPQAAADFHAIYRAAAAGWDVEPTPLPLVQRLLRDGAGRVFLCTAHHEGELLGAHLNLQHGRRVTAWLGATRQEHARTLFPATLLVWQGLVECAARHVDRFDLGGSAGRAQLAEFKRLLGARTEERGLYRRDVAWAAALRRFRSLPTRPAPHPGRP